MAVSYPKATAYKTESYKTIVYEPKNGVQVVDICEIDTGKLLARKQCERRTSGADGQWEWVYGSPLEKKHEVETMESSSKNPIFMRLDDDGAWCWRIRQIPWPASNYNVTVDEARNQIVVRTNNKKYFKRINAPDGEKFDHSKLEWVWSYSTLVIKHKKPARVIQADKDMQKWRRELPMQDDKEPECRV